jgi:hypothetical protein
MVISGNWRNRRAMIVAVSLSLSAIAGLASEPAHSKQDVLMTRNLSADEATNLGYQRVDVDLGDKALNLSFLAKSATLTTPLAAMSAIEAPGRGELLKAYVPDHRDAFELTVSVLEPGFAAEAPSVSEQLLMEGGYSIADAAHDSLVRADASGQSDSSAGIAKVARSICRTRGDKVVCLFMIGDAEHQDEFTEQASIVAGSLQFSNGEDDDFAEDQLSRVELPMAGKGSLALEYPAAWTIGSNDFSGSLPGTLQMYQGEEADPLSVLIVTASEGGAPPSAEAMDGVAQGMIDKWIADNDSVFANPVLATHGDLAGLASPAIGRSYAFVVDKLNGDQGKAQVRLTLVAAGGLRYSVLLVTHYAPEVDETGPFFVRLGGITGYDLAMRALLKTIQ